MTNLFMKMDMLKVDPDRPEEEIINTAARTIRDGGLVIFPTETVYGIAANLLNKEAIERLYKIKRRPAGKPFTVHISNIATLIEMVSDIPDHAKKLIDRFWPGPLTIILSSEDGKKIGFRMPANKIALSLIEASGVPVVAPSANISGKRPPRNIEEVLEDLDGGADITLDGGSCEVGVESTIVDATVFPCRILREGAITEAQLKKAWQND